MDKDNCIHKRIYTEKWDTFIVCTKYTQQCKDHPECPIKHNEQLDELNINYFDKLPKSLFPEIGGLPLQNEFLLKQNERKLNILQKYDENKYDELVTDLLELSDDIFDSKGDDITEKEFLENEMEFE